MITKFQLLMAFANRTPLTIKGTAFKCIESIQHEDGSGSSFNVSGYAPVSLECRATQVEGDKLFWKETVHIRTVD